MELTQLKYFQMAAKTEKIASAAQELFLSAPALSASIARLEKELGMPLFDRTGNRIVLNEQGQIFLRYVNEVFDTLERAETELRHSMLHHQRHIWLAITDSNLWLELIAAFVQEYPQFTLTCVTPSSDDYARRTFLLAEETDATKENTDEMEWVNLFRDEPTLLLHPDHPLAGMERIDVSMLRGETIFFPAQGIPGRERLLRLLRDSGVDPAAINACTYAICKTMVQQNLGVAFTTQRIGLANSGALRVIPLANVSAPWVMSLYWRRGHRMTPAEEAFRDFAQRYYRA